MFKLYTYKLRDIALGYEYHYSLAPIGATDYSADLLEMADYELPKGYAVVERMGVEYLADDCGGLCQIVRHHTGEPRAISERGRNPVLRKANVSLR